MRQVEQCGWRVRCIKDQSCARITLKALFVAIVSLFLHPGRDEKLSPRILRCCICVVRPFGMVREPQGIRVDCRAFHGNDATMSIDEDMHNS
jgi:hypothetical protein